MEKTLSVILIVAALIIGAICGVVLTPSEDVNCPVCEVCDVCEVCNCEADLSGCAICEATPNELLDTAIIDVLEYLDDEDELTCNGEEYDADEVEVTKIYDDFVVEYDDEDYEISGKIKLNYKQDDEKRCREAIEFSVVYEEDEDPEITIL